MTEQFRHNRSQSSLKMWLLPIIHQPDEISRMPQLILGHAADKFPVRDD